MLTGGRSEFPAAPPGVAKSGSLRSPVLRRRLLDGSADALACFVSASQAEQHESAAEQAGTIAAAVPGSAGWHPGSAGAPPEAACCSSAAPQPGAARSARASAAAAGARAAAGAGGCAGGCCAGARAGERLMRVPRRHAAELTYDDFVREHMAPNLPVIIQARPRLHDPMHDKCAAQCMCAERAVCVRPGT